MKKREAMKLRGKRQQYVIRPFDDEFDIVTSKYTNNLPLTHFAVSNGSPCVDLHSATSFENDQFKKEYFQFNEFESMQINELETYSKTFIDEVTSKTDKRFADWLNGCALDHNSNEYFDDRYK